MTSRQLENYPVAFMNKHKRIFLEHFEEPYACVYCGNVIEKIFGRESDSLAVHHGDGDNTNNSVENLKPMHMGCHPKHHHIGTTNNEIKQRWRNPDFRRKMKSSVVASNKRRKGTKKATSDQLEMVTSVRELRALGFTQRVIADTLGVGQPTVCRILRNNREYAKAVS